MKDESFGWMVDTGASPEIKVIQKVFFEMYHQRSARSKGDGVGLSYHCDTDLLMLIEALAVEVQRDNRPPFVNYTTIKGETRLRVNLSGQYLIHIGSCLKVAGPIGLPSPYREVFWDAYHYWGGRGASNSYFDSIQAIPPSLAPEGVAFFKNIIDRMREGLKQPIIRKAVNQRTSQANARYKAACTYVDSLFTKYAELAVVCLRLYTNKHFDTPADREAASKESVAFKNAFVKGGVVGSKLPGVVGIVGRWDCSPCLQIYAQTILFIDAKTISDSNELIGCISQYWIHDITNGFGFCESVVLPEELATNEPVSYIKKSDRKARHFVNDTLIRYLSVIDQYYSSESLEMKEKFFRGEIKKRKTALKDLESEKAESSEPILTGVSGCQGSSAEEPQLVLELEAEPNMPLQSDANEVLQTANADDSASFVLASPLS